MSYGACDACGNARAECECTEMAYTPLPDPTSPELVALSRATNKLRTRWYLISLAGGRMETAASLREIKAPAPTERVYTCLICHADMAREPMTLPIRVATVDAIRAHAASHLGSEPRAVRKPRPLPVERVDALTGRRETVFLTLDDEERNPHGKR